MSLIGNLIVGLAQVIRKARGEVVAVAEKVREDLHQVVAVAEEVVEAEVAWLRRIPMDELKAALDRAEKASPIDLDWRHSLVDLVKLSGADEVANRKMRAGLWHEARFEGVYEGTAEQNTRLRKWFLQQLSERAIPLPMPA